MYYNVTYSITNICTNKHIYTGLSCFIVLWFIVLHRNCIFYTHSRFKSILCWASLSGAIFPTAFDHFMSPRHILVTSKIPNFFFFLLCMYFFPTAQHGEPVTHTCIHSFFSHYVFHHNWLDRVPSATDFFFIIIFIMVISDQWAIAEGSYKGLHILAIKWFLKLRHGQCLLGIILLHTYTTVQYKYNFYKHWETKKNVVWLASFWYSV